MDIFMIKDLNYNEFYISGIKFTPRAGKTFQTEGAAQRALNRIQNILDNYTHRDRNLIIVQYTLSQETVVG